MLILKVFFSACYELHISILYIYIYIHISITVARNVSNIVSEIKNDIKQLRDHIYVVISCACYIMCNIQQTTEC